MKNILFIFLLFGVNLSCLADPGPPTMYEPQWLSASKASIKSGKFDQAIKLLQESNQVSSANWNNLMGFSLRQKQLPIYWSGETLSDRTKYRPKTQWRTEILWNA